MRAIACWGLFAPHSLAVFHLGFLQSKPCPAATDRCAGLGHLLWSSVQHCPSAVQWPNVLCWKMPWPAVSSPWGLWPVWVLQSHGGAGLCHALLYHGVAHGLTLVSHQSLGRPAVLVRPRWQGSMAGLISLQIRIAKQAACSEALAARTLQGSGGGEGTSVGGEALQPCMVVVPCSGDRLLGSVAPGLLQCMLHICPLPADWKQWDTVSNLESILTFFSLNHTRKYYVLSETQGRSK